MSSTIFHFPFSACKKCYGKTLNNQDTTVCHENVQSKIVSFMSRVVILHGSGGGGEGKY